jgi:DNA-binding CsgD family transcriptional regulator/PAS domain-containing protein
MAELLADDLIDAVYRSALDAGAWNDVIELMRGPFPSTVQAFYLLHLQPRRVEPVCVAGLDRRWLRTFDTLYFAADNPWMRVSQFLHRPGVVRTTERLESFLNDPGVLYRSTYYHEWMKPQGFKHNMGNTLLSEHGLVANITLFRSPDMPTFNDAEVRAFELLSKHMTRALQMSARLQPGLDGAASAALDAVPHALAVLDGRRRLLYANAAMESLLRQRHGLMLRDATLRAIDGSAEAALTALLADAQAPGHRASRSLGPLTLECPGRACLIVRAVPVTGGSASQLPLRAATLLLASPCRPRESPSHEELRHLYGCTHAEARLVQCLLDGRGLRDAAVALGITYGTARAYLKLVFQKTGVHTQAQLVAKLLGDAAAGPVRPDKLH